MSTTRMMRAAARLACAVALAAGLAACGTDDDGASDGATATVPATPSETATATAAPAPEPEPAATLPAEPVVLGAATLVKGTAECSPTFGTDTTDADGTEHMRDGSVACSYAMNDPRVTGGTTHSWSLDAWSDDQGESVLFQWGTSRLETEGGIWEGTYRGTTNERTGDSLSHWYRGTGAYEGLTFHVMFTGFGPWDLEGVIYPGEPPGVS